MDWAGRHDPQCHKHNHNVPWTLTHGFLLEMNGLTVDGSTVCHVTPGRHWGKYFLKVCVSELPRPLYISEAEINDKSKGDFLTKLFVVLQTTWFIFQVLARWIIHLPVTELEVITLGFAFLNIVTYALWWNKPQNMQVPIYVNARVGEGGQLGNDGHKMGIKESTGTSGIWWGLPYRIFRFICMANTKIEDMLIGNGDSLFYSSVHMDDSIYASIPMILVGLTFGGLHLIPLWTSPFPSTMERLLWITSVICVTLEPAIMLLYLFNRGVDVVNFLAFIGAWLYSVSWIILIILAFTTLRDLQPSSYQNIDWTTYIRHI